MDGTLSGGCSAVFGRLLALTCWWSLTTATHAEFTTVIDSPPAVLSSRGQLESDTQLNLYPGGVLPRFYNIGPVWEPGGHIEINLLGGVIDGDLSTSSSWVETTDVTVNLVEGEVRGRIDARHAALVTLTDATVEGRLRVDNGSLAIISGGHVMGWLTASDGSSVQLTGGTIGQSDENYGYFDGAVVTGESTFLMSGGELNGSLRANDSYVSLSGGRVLGDLSISSRSVLDWSGGSAGPLHVGVGSATLIGDHFAIDGVPVEGLDFAPHEIVVPEGSVLTGVLSDGTPIALTELGYLQDSLQHGTLRLHRSPTPANEPRAFNSPGDTLPNGLRPGQSLALGHGGVAPANFTALPGTQVTIAGGQMGRGFEAVDASVVLTEGRLGEQAVLLAGATLQASGGEIGSNFEVGPGSRFEMSGGAVGWQFVAHPGSEVHYSGGRFEGTLEAVAGSSFTVAGGDFKVNGLPLAALQAVGAQEQFDLPEHAILSGTLSDGTPFALGRRLQRLAPGSLVLQTVDVPPVETLVYRVPHEPAPAGLRPGQTLVLSNDGEIGQSFVADTGSFVRMTGGRIGHGFQAIGSFVNVSGGQIETVEALFGSVINFRGGESESVRVSRGGVFNLSGGELGSLEVQSGGRATFSGGAVRWRVGVGAESSLRLTGGQIEGNLGVADGGALTINGGVLHGRLSAATGALLRLNGGRLGDGLIVHDDATAVFRAYELRLNGTPLPTNRYGAVTVNELDLDRGDVLSGVFAAGVPFAFSSSDGDIFEPGSLLLSPEIGVPIVSTRASHFPPFGEAPIPEGLRPEQELTLEADDHAGDNFNAAWDSRLVIDGGEVGDNFEAVGARVELIDGAIGERADVFVGAELNVSGGTVGEGFQIHSGGVVNLAGGVVEETVIRDGGVLNITGGLLDAWTSDQHFYGEIALEAGAELNVMGMDFQIDNEPVEDLGPGQSVLFEWQEDTPRFSRSITLTATLQDGSPFAARIEGFPDDYLPDWRFEGGMTVRLTHAAPEQAVPEPAGAFAAAISIAALMRRRSPTR